ncbi:glycosyl hydrolase family 28 protein [Paenibacillus albus]|uniref:Glycoside hydrolase n=1 Tax=Paenibacillus albus TaxID=2495582 RepID=A0A3S9A3L3_9BACL|nr:glycosyl hydrolase family 28 protein [Paenibacillus albus]AZN40317.1 hypothetical protein EJC50_12175 [Paenibacillus albus]
MSHHYPKTYPRADEIRVFVNDSEVDVLRTNVAYFAPASYTGRAILRIESKQLLGRIAISPLNLGLSANVHGGTAEFEVPGNLKLHLAIEGISLPLFFYGNQEGVYDGSATYYFAGGKTYEVGELTLHNGESVYIESGAVVRGSIRSFGTKGIRIYGQGLLDGSYHRHASEHRTILLYDCTEVQIRDIMMVEPPSWMIMLANCRDVHIDSIKQIGEVVSSDGIDIVGCHDVLIEQCILRNNDDCVAIKSFNWTKERNGMDLEAAKDVYNVLVRDCTFVNGRSGNAIEIGHELTTDEVRDVTFQNIDIVSVHGYGAALSIHVGDRAVVRDIRFEAIRIEHYYDKLIDFRVMRSMYNTDEERGRIVDITLKDIEVLVSMYNPGYSISVIGGYDQDHLVENVTFDNFRLGQQKVTSANELDLFTKETRNIRFL